MYGGISEEGEYLGDLWVFDIVRKSWHMIITDSYIEHNEMSIPQNRAFAAGETFTKFGSVFLIGGQGDSGTTFCDVWVLDVEQTVNLVENPEKYNATNLWRELTLRP